MVVDLKTGKYPPSGPEVERHSQLGLYQLAVDHGAVDADVRRHVEGEVVSGGAELVQLRHGDVLPKVQHQSPPTGRRTPARRGAADAGRGDAARPRSSWPAPASTASAARSTRSAPTRPPGRCSRDRDTDRWPSTPPSSCATCSASSGPSATQQFARDHRAARARRGHRRRRLRQDHGDGRARRVARRHRPGGAAEILGLTFTTKATAELADPHPREPAPRRAAARPRRPARRRRRGGRGADRLDLPLLRRRRCSPSTACGSATSPTPG